MIAIINTGSPHDKGICTYRLQINGDILTTFTHDRKQGLATCLRKAAVAAEQYSKDQKNEILEAIREAAAEAGLNNKLRESMDEKESI